MIFIICLNGNSQHKLVMTTRSSIQICWIVKKNNYQLIIINKAWVWNYKITPCFSSNVFSPTLYFQILLNSISIYTIVTSIVTMMQIQSMHLFVSFFKWFCCCIIFFILILFTHTFFLLFKFIYCFIYIMSLQFIVCLFCVFCFCFLLLWSWKFPQWD